MKLFGQCPNMFFAHCNSVCLEVSDKWVVKLLKDGGIELGIPDGCEEEQEGSDV